MARPTTVQPTNTTITYPVYSSSADVEVLNTNFGNITEAINTINGKLLTYSLYGGDCDSSNTSSIVYVTGDASHSPGAWSIMNTMAYSQNDAITQLAFSVIDNTTKVRSYSVPNGGWSSWQQLVRNLNYLFGTSTNLSSFISSCDSLMNGDSGIVGIGFINYDQALQVGLPTSGYLIGLCNNDATFKKIVYYSSVDGRTRSIQKVSGTWDSAWSSNCVESVQASVPVGTPSGSYKLGTFSSLGIPSNATILSCLCCNCTSSYCITTGFSVAGNDIYVMLLGDVAVATGLVRVSYII